MEYDPESDDSEDVDRDEIVPLCAGVLQFMVHLGKYPRDPRYAAARLTVKANREQVFTSLQSFIEHHSQIQPNET